MGNDPVGPPAGSGELPKVVVSLWPEVRDSAEGVAIAENPPETTVAGAGWRALDAGPKAAWGARNTRH